MPKVNPAPGQAVEETTVTRVIPDVTKGRVSSDALEYMELTSPAEWDAGNHIVYLYRDDPPVFHGSKGPSYVAKFSNPISLEQIQSEFGGGVWRICVKRGSERMAERPYSIAGAPRDLGRGGCESGQPASNGNGDGSVMSQALNIAANPSAQAAGVNVLQTAANSAIELVKNNAAKPLSVAEILEIARQLNPPAAPETPFFQTQLGQVAMVAITAMINRLITPTDPLEQMVKMADVISKFSGGGNGASDWKAALVNVAPKLANAVQGTVQELRLGAEAQAKLNMTRTLPPAQPAAPTPATPPPTPNVVTMPNPPAPAADASQLFDLKLIELLNAPDMTGDKAGEILDEQWPDIVTQISQCSLEQLVDAFCSRPLLKPYANHPRLRKFLAEFLEWAKEPNQPGPSPIAPVPVA